MDFNSISAGGHIGIAWAQCRYKLDYLNYGSLWCMMGMMMTGPTRRQPGETLGGHFRIE
ncbi:MAG: hypothetical protein KA586_00875 [Candidatus Promineofilum sp.]|nr:hypothetical protein [Promineifilum sp.]